MEFYLERKVFPVSASPKETWQERLLTGMSSAMQVLTAMVPPQPQITWFLFRSKMPVMLMGALYEII